MDKRFLENCLAKEMSLEAIGEQVGKHPSTVSYWLKKHGLSARGADKYARRGAIARKALGALVESGATVAEMAESLDRSTSTVRYWLRRYELRTVNPHGPRSRCGGGSKFATFECHRHGITEFILEGRGYYRCKRACCSCGQTPPNR